MNKLMGTCVCLRLQKSRNRARHSRCHRHHRRRHCWHRHCYRRHSEDASYCHHPYQCVHACFVHLIRLQAMHSFCVAKRDQTSQAARLQRIMSSARRPSRPGAHKRARRENTPEAAPDPREEDGEGVPHPAGTIVSAVPSNKFQVAIPFPGGAAGGGWGEDSDQDASSQEQEGSTAVQKINKTGKRC